MRIIGVGWIHTSLYTRVTGNARAAFSPAHTRLCGVVSLHAAAYPSLTSLSPVSAVMEVRCPQTFHCDPPNASFDIGRAPSYVSITSSSLSCLGSILIVVVYLVLKDVRTGAQKVITLLAIADFLTAFGYIIGSANFLHHFNVKSNERCEIFHTVCEIQSFVTTWSTMCSYAWNSILAFYFFVEIVYNRPQLAARLLPLYNVIAWAAPLTIVIPLLAYGKLGYAPYVASNWCYIKDTDYSSNLRHKGDTIAFILIAGKLWEMIIYVFILVLYCVLTAHISKVRHRYLYTFSSEGIFYFCLRQVSLASLFSFGLDGETQDPLMLTYKSCGLLIAKMWSQSGMPALLRFVASSC